MSLGSEGAAVVEVLGQTAPGCCWSAVASPVAAAEILGQTAPGCCWSAAASPVEGAA